MRLTARVFKETAEVAVEQDVKSSGLELCRDVLPTPRGETGRSAAGLTKSAVAYLDTGDRQLRGTSNCNLTLVAAELLPVFIQRWARPTTNQRAVWGC